MSVFAYVSCGFWPCGHLKADDGRRTFVLKLAKDVAIVRGKLQIARSKRTRFAQLAT